MPYTNTDQSVGAMQPFYMAYIIKKENPLNAFASFLEIKGKALNAAIALMSKQMEYYSAYIEILNEALRAINAKTNYNASGKNEKNKDYIAMQAFVIAAYFLRHQPRMVTDADGKTYFLLQYDDQGSDGKSGISGFLGGKGRYLMVPADAGSLSAFVNSIVAQSNPDSKGNVNNDFPDVHIPMPDDYQETSYVTTNSLSYQPEESCYLLKLNEEAINESVAASAFKDGGAIDYSKLTSFTVGGQTYTVQMMKPDPIGYPSGSNGLPTFASDVRHYSGELEIPVGTDEKRWSTWNDACDVDSNVVTAWLNTLQSRIQSMNTEIQSIQNDIASKKGKTETFDTAASGLRSRGQDVSMSVIGNIM
jgi:hypothetical protein